MKGSEHGRQDKKKPKLTLMEKRQRKKEKKSRGQFSPEVPPQHEDFSI